MTGGIEVRVENQLVRFLCPEPVGHQEVIEQLDAQAAQALQAIKELL